MSYDPDYIERDTETLRKKFPQLLSCKDETIQNLWSVFSDEYYCAGWIAMDDIVLQKFKRWLGGERGEYACRR